MFTTILIGNDGRDGGEEALALAQRLSSATTTLVACTIATGGKQFEDAQRSTRAFARRHPDVGTEVHVAVEVGDGLAHAAAQHQADLLVIGSCHRGLAGRVLAGDDTTATLRAAPCTVAVAPKQYRPDGTPFTRIGVGHDGSAEADAALALARALADENDAEIIAEDVVRFPYAIADAAFYPALSEAATAAAEERLAAIPDVEHRTEVSSPIGALRTLSTDVDLLVIGLRKRGTVSRLLEGSVAEGLAGHCACPVVAVAAT